MKWSSANIDSNKNRKTLQNNKKKTNKFYIWNWGYRCHKDKHVKTAV